MSDVVMPGGAVGVGGFAGFWIRTAAVLLDCVFMALIAFALGVALPAGDVVTYSGRYISYNYSSNLPWQGLSGLVYTIGFWVVCGATPGKLVLGLRIVAADTLERIGLGRSVVRYIGYLVSGFVFMLGFLWVAFDRRKQGWHDKIAGTVVVHSRGMRQPLG